MDLIKPLIVCTIDQIQIMRTEYKFNEKVINSAGDCVISVPVKKKFK